MAAAGRKGCPGTASATAEWQSGREVSGASPLDLTTQKAKGPPDFSGGLDCIRYTASDHVDVLRI
jgi:hypothetical protein